MKEVLITQLRNTETNIDAFREASDKLASLLAIESAKFIIKKQTLIQGTLCQTSGLIYNQKVCLIPILRSGLVLLYPFLKFFSDASVGFFGINRNEKTFLPKLYYEKLPKISESEVVFLLDPMLATSGSASLAIDTLVKKGIKAQNIKVISIIASDVGIKTLEHNYPEVEILAAKVDEGLNDKMYIVPGLGDFGDRYFGTI
jgi:uracil phosphoribosyltransferase